jgi:signal peptidase I
VSQRSPGSSEPVDAPRAGSGFSYPAPSRPPEDEHKDETEHKGTLSFLRELPVLIVLAFVLAVVLKTFVVQAFYIPSGSMEPTLNPGDRVLVNKAFFTPHRYDIIVFSDPHGGSGPDRGLVGGFLHWLSEGLGVAHPEDEDFIKRVIVMPGEQIKIRNHVVYADGTPLTEPYLTPGARASMADYGPITVPDDSLFVMGDNRGNSNDSRAGLGFIPLDKVIGGAFVIIWPPSRMSWVH